MEHFTLALLAGLRKLNDIEMCSVGEDSRLLNLLKSQPGLTGLS